MTVLSGQEIVRIWEAGADQHPLERALTIVAAGFPRLTREQLGALSLGQRDSCLLTMWERTFGATLDGYAECPRCRERLEFALSVPSIRSGQYPDLVEPPEPHNAMPGPVHELAVDGYTVCFRLPASRDLAAVAACGEPAAGYALLVRRCVLAAEHDGTSVSGDSLPTGVVVALAQRMAEADPQAEILLDLTCPACGAAWQVPVDVAGFFWSELAVEAKRLLGEVHLLARAYGWREADILAMGARRRQSYLEMVEA
jgi:hypothetical protein